MRKTMKVLVAFIAGQAVQLVVHAVALNLWSSRQIPFCLAGGFIVLVALICGIVLSDSETVKQEGNHEKKTYEDYAKIPETKTVIDPLKAAKIVREVAK